MHALGDISRLLAFPAHSGGGYGEIEGVSWTQVVPLRAMDGFLVGALVSCAVVALVPVYVNGNKYDTRRLRLSMRTHGGHLLTVIVIAARHYDSYSVMFGNVPMSDQARDMSCWLREGRPEEVAYKSPLFNPFLPVRPSLIRHQLR